MSGRPGGISGRGRRGLFLSRRSPNRDADSDDDSENSRCPSPLLAIEGGYRVDPFVRYPVSRASTGVKFMADYYIQVWAPQQAQAFSVQNGRNALLALVLPLAFENTMLFEATIAMTRAAWVLRRCSDPFADKMLLRHRGLALMQLRSTLVSPDHRHSDLVLMTMSTLLTLNYMINDVESFEIHLQTLEHMLQSYTPDNDNELRKFVRGRVLAFGVLASFLHARQPSYATRINEPGHRISTLTYPGHPFLPELCALIAKLPEGFGEVALSRSIAVELISFLVRLAELINWMSLSPGPPSSQQRQRQRHPDLTMQRAIYDLQCLSVLPLTPVEAQIVRALLAFCLHLYNEMSFHIPLARPLRPLLEAFNEQTEIPRSPWLQRCLVWCSMVMASAWDRQIDAPATNHVVLDALVSRVSETRSWEETEGTMRKFFWHDRLANEWEICWRAASFRRHRQRRGASQIVSFAQLLRESSQNSETSRTSSDDYL